MAELQASMKTRVLQVRTPDASARRPYDNALVRPVSSEPADLPGLKWSLYDGEWPWLPEFRTFNSATNGAIKSVALPMATAGRPFGVLFEGYFNAKQDGEYKFSVTTDTGAMLFLHDIRLIDEPMKSSAGRFSGSVRLKAGWHPLRLYYRHARGKADLELTAVAPDGLPLKLDATTFRQSAK
jgi:hypothetical protein